MENPLEDLWNSINAEVPNNLSEELNSVRLTNNWTEFDGAKNETPAIINSLRSESQVDINPIDKTLSEYYNSFYRPNIFGEITADSIPLIYQNPAVQPSLNISTIQLSEFETYTNFDPEHFSNAIPNSTPSKLIEQSNHSVDGNSLSIEEIRNDLSIQNKPQKRKIAIVTDFGGTGIKRIKLNEHSNTIVPGSEMSVGFDNKCREISHNYNLDDSQIKTIKFLENNSHPELNANLLFWNFILFLLDHPINKNVDTGLKWITRSNGCFLIYDLQLFSRMWARLRRSDNQQPISIQRILKYYQPKEIMKKHEFKKMHFILFPKKIEWSNKYNLGINNH